MAAISTPLSSCAHSVLPTTRSAGRTPERDPRRSELDDGLADVECFGVSRARSTLHAPEPHQPHEGLAREPVLVALGAEGVVQVLDLLLADRLVERDEAVGRAEIAVELRDLVL